MGLVLLLVGGVECFVVVEGLFGFIEFGDGELEFGFGFFELFLAFLEHGLVFVEVELDGAFGFLDSFEHLLELG